MTHGIVILQSLTRQGISDTFNLFFLWDPPRIEPMVLSSEIRPSRKRHHSCAKMKTAIENIFCNTNEQNMKQRPTFKVVDPLTTLNKKKQQIGPLLSVVYISTFPVRDEGRGGELVWTRDRSCGYTRGNVVAPSHLNGPASASSPGVICNPDLWKIRYWIRKWITFNFPPLWDMTIAYC